jgi:hypothetical protein
MCELVELGYFCGVAGFGIGVFHGRKYNVPQPSRA